MGGKIFNKPQYKERRQTLRNNMPTPEIKLWQILRNKQMGYKFRRQHSISNYIVDFYSPKLKLIIEVDGDSHYIGNAQNYDKIRDEYLNSFGIKVLRVKNSDIMNNIEGVYLYIKNEIERITP